MNKGIRHLVNLIYTEEKDDCKVVNSELKSHNINEVQYK